MANMIYSSASAIKMRLRFIPMSQKAIYPSVLLGSNATDSYYGVNHKYSDHLSFS